MTSEDRRNLIGIAPYFVVSDLAASLDYYCDVLGFVRPQLWGDPPTFAMPHRDGLILMLNQRESDAEIVPNRAKDGYWDAYVWVRDVDALSAEFERSGASFAYGLTVRQEYGNKEFAVTDPDGYLIAFGQDVGSQNGEK